MRLCFWSEFVPQHYLYCEERLCGWLQQPANTWSNIGYLIVALMILPSDKPRLEKLFFFWASFLLFLGSTFFHMSGTHIGKNLDVGAMLILSMGICALSVQRWYGWEFRKTLSFYLVGLAASLTFLLTMGFGNVPFIIEIVTAAVLEFRMLKQGRSLLDGRRLLASCVVEAFAFVFLILDITKTWCNPKNHILNGHAVWHLFSAAAIYLLFSATKKKGPEGPSF